MTTQDIRDAWRAVRVSGVPDASAYQQTGDALCDAYDELLKRRDVDWVLAMASALEPDSGFSVPLMPETEPFSNLFAAVIAPWKEQAEKAAANWHSAVLRIDEIRNERDEARAQLGSTIEHSARIAKDRDNFETKFKETAKDRDEWADAIRSVAPGYISSAHAAKAAIAEMKAKWDAAEKKVEGLEERYEQRTIELDNRSDHCNVLKEERDALLLSCPCKHTTPCSDQCSCTHPGSSAGCRRCCAYGSPEQQKAKAESIVATLAKLQDFQAAVAYELGAERNPDLALDALRARLKELKELKSPLKAWSTATQEAVERASSDLDAFDAALAKLAEVKSENDRLRVRDSNLTFHDRNVMGVNQDLRAQLAAMTEERDKWEHAVADANAAQGLMRGAIQASDDHCARLCHDLVSATERAEKAEAENKLLGDALTSSENSEIRLNNALAAAEKLLDDKRSFAWFRAADAQKPSEWTTLTEDLASHPRIGQHVTMRNEYGDCWRGEYAKEHRYSASRWTHWRAHDSSGSAEQSGVAQREQSNEGNEGPLDRPAPEPAGTTCGKSMPGTDKLCALPRGHEGLHDPWTPGLRSPHLPAVPACRGCHQPLAFDSAAQRIADGCPCNSPRGVNHGLVPSNVCTCAMCDPEQTGSVRRQVDPRPLCVDCGRPWVPPEGCDATVTSCGKCVDEVSDLQQGAKEVLFELLSRAELCKALREVAYVFGTPYTKHPELAKLADKLEKR
jgi:hypothetical protein